MSWAECFFIIWIMTQAAMMTESADDSIEQNANTSSVRSGVIFEDPESTPACESRSGTAVKCMSFNRCRRITGMRTVGPICSWKGKRPRVCCPVPQQATQVVTPAVKPLVKLAATSLRYCGRRIVGPSRRRFMRQAFLTQVGKGYEKSVVGGQDSFEDSWPWMAGIYRSNGGFENFLCGSAIIGEKYLVTAAHCFGGSRNANASNYIVRVGTIMMNFGSVLQLDSIIIHPEYSSRQHYNDIAVVKLKDPLVFSSNVQPICVPTDGNLDVTGHTVTLVGWGDQEYGGIRSKILQEVEIPVVNTDGCNSTYSSLRDSAIPKGITAEDFICAGFEEGGKDACQSDSGGPLMYNEGGTWILVGVVSFGYKCAVPDFPGVYTRVAKHLEWLRNVTE